jgi:death-on-curing protein
MIEPRFLTSEAVMLVHHAQVASFGGAQGVNEENMLRSTLGLARKTWSYTNNPYETAVQYYISMTRNKPFYGGNKRTGLACMLVFLAINGIEPAVPPEQLLEWTTQKATTGGLGREGLATRLRQAPARE